MKKLYIIEVDESDIVECWNERAVKEIGYQEYALKQCPKIKVRPYNYSGDCISREALKAKIFDIPKLEEGETFWDGVDTVGNLIDNAPTVEVYTKDDMTGAYNEGYVCGSRESERKRRVDRPNGR